MGLKLLRSCNLVTTLLKKKQNVGDLIFTSQDTQINPSKRLLKLVSSIGFDQVQGSMDRLLEQRNREFVRSTMMKQEEIFKHQVRELHQLYRVQKMLMAELRIKESHAKNKYWGSASTSGTSHSSYIINRNHTAPHLKSEYNSLHQNNTMDEEECDVDLTLRIGCSSTKKKLKNRVHSEPTTMETKQECSERESLQRQPPWLFQAMSLNRT